ncbi:MAG: thymidylate kinase [Ruminococcaceae bacterium]|nr:thymidylate kinase [Oscillospiraceae bacterium]
MENNQSKKGRIIVIEGLDGSGKGTQSKILMEKLSQQYKVRKISFPDYDSPASQPVQMYLNGEFGSNASCVNSFAAASFYAVDRVASYLKDWKQDYESGTVFVLDRYVTSNMIYMPAKLPKNEWDSFLSWLSDFEYDKLGLPRPDGVIYLDMPTEISQKLMSGRYNNDESKKDLHEKDVAFLNACRESALYAADNQGWMVIACNEGDAPRTIEDIASEVYKTACAFLED